MKSPALNFTDVTLRDGLQMEARVLSVDDRLRLLKKLIVCPFNKIEITSFVSAKWMPQFADADAFCKAIFSSPWPSGAPEAMAFTPNERGLERLLAFPIPWVSCFIAASETFNKKNINIGIVETLKVLEKLIARSHVAKRKIRVYISTAFGCPYEKEIPEGNVAALFRQIAALGPDEIALSDTIGVAWPGQVQSLLHAIKDLFPSERLALHLHNTYDLAVASAIAGWQAGVSQFDGSTGGIGGCPYAKGATGNAPLESLLYAFFRQKNLAHFPQKQLEEVLRCLDKELGLHVQSALYDILKKGGTIYAV